MSLLQIFSKKYDAMGYTHFLVFSSLQLMFKIFHRCLHTSDHAALIGPTRALERWVRACWRHFFPKAVRQ